MLSPARSHPGAVIALLLTGGCIEIPEFDPPRIPANLGAALDEEPDNCSPGGFECACRPDDSCDAGLACIEGVCQGPDTGDGDGDPTTTTGDGDGDPTTGDGDGDPTTGDGDGDPLPECEFDSDCPYAHTCEASVCVLQANLAFVTSQTFTPDFGGLAGADALCNLAAEQAGLAGNFVALLTDSQNLSYADRLTGASGWVRTDFRNVANAPEDVAIGALRYPLTYDEFGNDIGGVPVYTGGVEGVEHCDDWTAASPNSTAGLGYSADGSWESLAFSFQTCSEVQAHLYCYQVDKIWEGNPPLPPSYRYAFLSSMPIYATDGIAVMDQFCQSDAAQAGFADNGETYKAWVGDVGQSPNSRFDLGGPPWVRVDGVSIVESGADLADPSSYLAPITVSAFGYHSGGWVWTGSTGPQVPGDPSMTCDGWFNVEAFAAVGVASRRDEQFGPGVVDCFQIVPTYCLQE